MARLIDADAMKEELLWGNVYLSDNETNALVDLIENQPTIDPESLRPTREQVGTGGDTKIGKTMSVFVKCEYVENICANCANWRFYEKICPYDTSTGCCSCEEYQDSSRRENGRRVRIDDTCVHVYNKKAAIAKDVKRFIYEANKNMVIIGNKKISEDAINYLSVDYGDHTTVYIDDTIQEDGSGHRDGES